MFREDFSKATAVDIVKGFSHVVVKEPDGVIPPSLYAFERGVGGPVGAEAMATGMKYGRVFPFFNEKAFLVSFEVVVREGRVIVFGFVVGLSPTGTKPIHLRSKVQCR